MRWPAPRQAPRADPAPEVHALLHPQAPRKPLHRGQPPAVPADHELGLHRTRGVDQDSHSLGGDHATREHDAPAVGVSGAAHRGRRAEQRDHGASGEAVRGEVAVDGARVADRDVGALERRESAAGTPVGSGQRLRTAGVRAASRREVGHAPRPVGSRALVARPEVVHAGGARRVTVCAYHHRGALAQPLDDVGIVDLVKVTHLRREGHRLAKPRLHRGLCVEQPRTVKNAHPGDAVLRTRPGPPAPPHANHPGRAPLRSPRRGRSLRRP